MDNKMMEALQAQAQHEEQLKTRMEKEIANEVMKFEFDKKILLKNNFEELKKAIMPHATTIAMQLPLDQFRKTKSRMMEKTKHHAYTLAEVACVCNAFEQNGNDHNMGSMDTWDWFAVRASTLGKEAKKCFQEITDKVTTRLRNSRTIIGGTNLIGTRGEA